MSPPDILATAALGFVLSCVVGYIAYRAVMWIANRVIAAMDSVTRFER